MHPSLAKNARSGAPRTQSNFPKQAGLARVLPLVLGQQEAGRALLQHLHHRGGSPDLGFAEQKVDVFRHNHISHHHEAGEIRTPPMNGEI